MTQLIDFEVWSRLRVLDHNCDRLNIRSATDHDETHQLKWAAFMLRILSVRNLSDHRDLLSVKIFPHRGIFACVKQIDHFRMDIAF